MMTEIQNDLVYQFSTLLVVLDPIATVPVFMAITKDLSRKHAIRVALYSVIISFGILLFFIIFGQIFLNALGIPLSSFQLAGSILLFLLGLEMVQGKTEGSINQSGSQTSLLKRAAYPLAIPVIAGAAGMLTVVMLTNNDTRSIAQQAQTIFILALCLSIHFVSFSLSGFIKKYLGETGIETISRVFGLILTSIAVTGIIAAIKISFGLN